MPEKGRFNPDSYENSYVIGDVEKSVKDRIEKTANKILETKILQRDHFENDVERNNEADEIVESLGSGFNSYNDLVDATIDKNLTEKTKDKARESLDILKKSTALAMNSGEDQKLQTDLNLGKEDEVKDALPVSWQYVNKGSPDVVLSREIIGATITDKVLLDKVRRLDRKRRRSDENKWNERRNLAESTEDVVNDILDMDIPRDKEDQFLAFKCYLSDEAGKLREKRELVSENGVEVVLEKDKKKVDLRAVSENRQGNETGYRSPYEVTPESFVDSIFNYENPRLYFSPPPEFFQKLSKKEQYLFRIQQRLSIGAESKLGSKDFDAGKARENPIYNFSTTELALIYEMPGVREAMETFVNDSFELYDEDGRWVLRLKQIKKDGKATGKLTKEVEYNFGDEGSGQSFEDYKDLMFLKMALRKIFPNETSQLDNIEVKNIKDRVEKDDEWVLFYNNVIKDYIDKFRDKNPNKENITDAELESKWRLNNTLEEKKAVATAWNFLFVGNIVESADVSRKMKPTQVVGDKVRTMMMPLEKFLAKLNIRRRELTGKEELFAGNLALWAKERFKEEGKVFADKLIKAADTNRNELKDEEAMWRLLPKRTMSGFTDMYLVRTEKGERKNKKNKTREDGFMTMSEALIEGEKIFFEFNDLDVFTDLRDTWDEVLSITPFLIDKAEFSPTEGKKKLKKFSSKIEKLKGQINKIETASLVGKEKFESQDFVNYPEFYAWLIANSVGLEKDLDIPVLDQEMLGSNKDNYDLKVLSLIRGLDLDSNLNLVPKIKKILTAEGYLRSKGKIEKSKSRAAERETIRRRDEKKK